MDRLHPEYVEAARYLYNRINYEKSSDRPYDQQNYRLARMEALLETLGTPQFSAPVIHVAGTKGKGSVSWQVAEILRNSGYSVGLYTSPHLEFLEERFVVNADMVTPEVLVNTISELRSKLENWDEPLYGTPTFFELTTAIAWLIFKNAKTDVNVVEVGMGGRLDSTNVCQSLMSIITPISFDHQDQLGDTIAKIAAEKAGIIKPGSYVIAGAGHPEARKIIEDISEQKNCRLLAVDRNFKATVNKSSQSTQIDCSRVKRTFNFEALQSATAAPSRLQSISNLDLRMVGVHQAENAALAIAAAQQLMQLGWNISEQTIRKTLGRTQVPSRIEVLQEHPTIVLDAAHNAASVTALVEAIENDFAPCRRTFVFASSKDKDYGAMLDILMPLADCLIVTQFGSNPRHLPVEKLEEACRSRLARFPNLQFFSTPTIDQATQFALRSAESNDLICFTGSFFMSSEVKQALNEVAPG